MSVLSYLILEYWKFFFPIIIYFIIFTGIKKSFRKNQKFSIKYTNGNYNKNKENTDKTSADDDGLAQLLKNEKSLMSYNGPNVTLEGGAEKFLEIANDRKNVTKFSENLIDYGIIEKCIYAAATGPYQGQRQPWTFCVVANSLIKLKIREIIEREEYINYKEKLSKSNDLEPLITTNYIKEYLTEAPFIILIFRKTKNTKNDQIHLNEIAIPIAVGIFLMAIQCSGLCSLVTTPTRCGHAIEMLLNRPENEKLEVLLPVGYAANNCLVSDGNENEEIDPILVKY